MAKRDYYDVLGVDRTADDKALKSAYRKLAMQYHPDRNPGDAAAEACFKEVGEGVEAGTLLASVTDPFGEVEQPITAPAPGIILGRAMMPVINEGDACYHIAATSIDPLVRMARLAADLEADPMFDEDEIL